MDTNILLLFIIGLSCAYSLNEFGDPSVTQIDPWGTDSLRIRITVGGAPKNLAVQALLPNPPKNTKGEIYYTPLYTSNGNIAASVEDGKLVVTRLSDKKVLLQESGHSFGTSFSAEGTTKASISFEPQDEDIYGLGEHRTGKLQNKPYTHSFQRSQIYSYSIGGDISIPFYQSSAGYGFLWNLPSFGSVSILANGTSWVSNAATQLDFWVTTTSSSDLDYAEIMHNYVDATGHPPPMPFHASGFWQCKNRYRNETELLSIANGYYTRNLPLSVIVVDYYNWVNFGDWAFNPACWQTPANMVSNLNGHGTEIMVSVWPNIVKESHNFKAMYDNGYLVMNSSGTPYPFRAAGRYTYDPFNPDARKFVWDQVKKGYYDNGVKMYWLDADEPERQLPDTSGQWYYAAGQDEQVGMAYPLLHQQTFYDGLKAEGEDVVLLSRSAWAGSQRYGAAVWSGDISSTFAELAIQVRVAQNVAMSGLYWWTTDIGGYKDGNINDATFQELIVRWFQFGAFCPLFRTHGHRSPSDPNSACGGSGGPNEVWRFGDTAYNVISKVILLREQLRDYIMKHMQIASEIGTPIVRPMFWEFPNDPCASADDQYMFGPDWLVAPVLEYQAKSRQVCLPVLPKGYTWVHHYTQKAFGPGKQTIPTPIDEFPLFYLNAE